MKNPAFSIISAAFTLLSGTTFLALQQSAHALHDRDAVSSLYLENGLAVSETFCSPSSWSGTWSTSYGDMTLRLKEDGSLTGVYGTSRHGVTGQVVSNGSTCTLLGNWRHNGSSIGRFTFDILTPGEFSGRWTYGDVDPSTGGTNWTGTQTASSTSTLSCNNETWEGAWSTGYGDMNLSSSADGLLSGVYGPSRHAVVGRPLESDPCILVGQWQHNSSTNTGRFMFQVYIENEFVGRWTWNDADPFSGGTGWSGKR